MIRIRVHAFLTAMLALATVSAPAWATVDNYPSRWREFVRDAGDHPPAISFPYQTCFDKAARRYELPVTLLIAVAKGESDFKPRARSSANAWGLMQIRWPQTANHLGIDRLGRLLDPCTNIDAGARYLRELLDRFGQDLHVALIAYNRGPTWVASMEGQIPVEQQWYSGYIYRHLRYVLGDGVPTTVREYSQDRRVPIIDFRKPYRALAMLQVLEGRLPGSRFEWFDDGLGYYRVVLVYGDQQEYERGRAALQRMGIGRGLRG